MSHSKDNFQQFVVKIAALFGFFQGIVWGFLSLIAIIWHLAANHDRPITFTDSYSSLLETYMYYNFIKNNGPKTTMNIQPDSFFGIMFIYLLISFAWMSVSVYISDTNNRKNQKALIIWVCLATINLLIDLVFCALLGADYKSLINKYNQTKNTTLKLAYTYSTLCYAIVMVLAARGFILWVINLVLTGFVIGAGFDQKLGRPDPVKNTAFSSIQRSNVYMRNLPEEARNFPIDETRRRTEPGPASTPSQYDLLSTSSSFGHMLSNYDPQVERRLQQYTLVLAAKPLPSKKR
ncbi:hypothetical protein TcasGA2_TC032701 [Tribolium castaneum]|uniref:Uncharacterized protein n=1 Tax=Tribolium castaneum TaxID=7070 RepID=A0A139WK43_TRICA|nr:hypothetical protein TcasGA2_TC032701 [Tribolium castaneum]